MRIAVAGSWRETDRREWKLVDEREFRKAAAAIGAELARLGHVLIVGSDREDTADYHAALGAISVASTRPAVPRVHILSPNNRTGMFKELRRQHPGLFTEGYVPASDWAPAKVFQVRKAHGVVVVAGAKGSQQAGLIAAVSGKPLVCVGGFGGAARTLNQLFMSSRDQWGPGLPDEDTMGTLQGPWSADLVHAVTAGVRATNKPRLLIIHGRSGDRDLLKVHLESVLHLPDPVILANHVTPGEVLPVKFEDLASSVDGAIALVTPDDIGSLADGVSTPENRARQNVWIEVGWFWGRMGRRRVLTLRRGKVEIPSDLHGMENYEYTSKPDDCAPQIQAFVEQLARGS